jgi:hypothetical protein
MDRGRAGCVCGCFVDVADILAQALEEAQRGSVQAVVIVGDHFHGNLDRAVATAKQLRKAGVRLFLFQQATDGSACPQAFKALAEATGGAFFQFNPHVERVAERLPSFLEAVTHFAIGGTGALAAQDNESALLLLEQMEATRREIKVQRAE